MIRVYSALVFIFVMSSAFGEDKIVLWDRNYDRDAFREILTLAMDLTEAEYGPYSIQSSRPLEQGAAFAGLTRDTALNVAIAAVSLEREASVQVIYIPIDKGLLGFRICLVNPGKQHIFAEINTLSDINKARFSVGVGSHWPDRTIIEDNGLRTIHSENYLNLFDMLQKERFNCFLRSVNEIDYEIASNAERGFTDEQHIAILYPSADFIFVAKSEQRLKTRIEKGIRIAMENGDFDAYFEKYYMTVLQKYNFFNRKLLFLKNKHVSDKALKAINVYGMASFTN